MCIRDRLYSLNPIDNAAIGSVMGCFQHGPEAGYIQQGSAWWFNDNKTGITEPVSYTYLRLPWFFGAAFFIFMLVQFFRGVPKELDEAAEIDGCGRIAILFRILAPVVKPSIITASIFAFY